MPLLVVVIVVVVVFFRRVDTLDRLLICPKEEQRIADKHNQQENPCELGDDSQEEQHKRENGYQGRDQSLSPHTLVDHHGKDERGDAQCRRPNGHIGANDIPYSKCWSTTSRS